MAETVDDKSKGPDVVVTVPSEDPMLKKAVVSEKKAALKRRIFVSVTTLVIVTIILSLIVIWITISSNEGSVTVLHGEHQNATLQSNNTKGLDSFRALIESNLAEESAEETTRDGIDPADTYLSVIFGVRSTTLAPETDGSGSSSSEQTDRPSITLPPPLVEDLFSQSGKLSEDETAPDDDYLEEDEMISTDNKVSDAGQQELGSGSSDPLESYADYDN